MSAELQVAIVTGAAGGIGGACAKRLAADACLVLAADMGGPDPDSRAFQDALRVAGPGDVVDVALDVTNPVASRALARALTDLGRSADVLVNAAGVLQDITPLGALSDEAHDRVWRVNYHGVYNCSRTFGLAMAARGRGAIVNISSINAFRSTPLLAYAPAKAALNSLTACLAAEFGPRQVRVNAVCPGFTLTPLLREKLAQGLRDEGRILEGVALGRWVEPEEVAAAVSFLCSSEAAAVTGVSLPVDAGWLAGSSWRTFGGVRHGESNLAGEELG